MTAESKVPNPPTVTWEKVEQKGFDVPNLRRAKVGKLRDCAGWLVAFGPPDTGSMVFVPDQALRWPAVLEWQELPQDIPDLWRASVSEVWLLTFAGGRRVIFANDGQHWWKA